jgi:hypothetical protein
MDRPINLLALGMMLSYFPNFTRLTSHTRWRRHSRPLWTFNPTWDHEARPVWQRPVRSSSAVWVLRPHWRHEYWCQREFYQRPPTFWNFSYFLFSSTLFPWRNNVALENICGVHFSLYLDLDLDSYLYSIQYSYSYQPPTGSHVPALALLY